MNKRIKCTVALGILVANTVSNAATFEVSSVSEFRTALNTAANNGESNIIDLAAGTYLTTDDGGGTFFYNSVTNFNLTIQDGDISTPNDVILDGGTVDEVIVLKNEEGKGSFALTGLTLQNGLRGARVENANLDIESVQFLNNSSNGLSGAGLYFPHYSYDVNINNSYFFNNKAINYWAAKGGGAYINANNITLTNSNFVQNSAINHAGGVFLDGRTSLVENSAFSDNSSDEQGGAIYSSTKLTIHNSQFNRNASDVGGAISGSVWLVDSSVFIGNTAEYQGAALKNANTITNSNFINNNSIYPTHMTSYTLACASCELLNNLFDNNAVNAEVYISSGADSLSNFVANNIFINTQRYLFGAVNSNHKVNLKNNFLDLNKLGFTSEQLFQEGNVFGSDAGLDENYDVLSGSVLIDAGYAGYDLFTLAETDALGHGRVVGLGVDIGPIEYGSSFTHPQISAFSLFTNTPKNMQDLTFSVSYSLFESRTLSSLAFDNGQGEFEVVALDDNNEFNYVYIEPGKKVLRLRLIDSEGQESTSTLAINLGAQSTENVILISQNACLESPSLCNIDTDNYYSSGYNTAMTACENDPSLCGVNTETFITTGKNICINDPSACGIKADFDYTQLPTTASVGWKLMGTSEAVLNMSQFVDVKVVWALVGNTWHAYSPDNEVSGLLAAKSIPVLTTIPAFSGFWVTK